MNNGKFSQKKRPGFRKSLRAALPLLLIAIVIALSAGGTLAYILDNTSSVENTFTPAQVSCVVQNNGKIENTSNVKAFIRAMVIVNWMDDDGNVSASAPVYTVVAGDKWAKSDTDGFYYYTDKVAPNEVLPAPATIDVTSTNPDGTQYKATVEIVAEAIQAEGMGDDVDTAQEAWAAAKSRPTNP